MKKQYIDKSAVKAELERIEHETNYEPFTDEVLGKRFVCRSLLSFLDTLEVKEVEEPSKDLEEAASQYQSVIRTISPQWVAEIEKAFIAGAKWMEQRLKDKCYGATKMV